MKPLPATGAGSSANGLASPVFTSTRTMRLLGAKPTYAESEVTKSPSGSSPEAGSNFATSLGTEWLASTPAASPATLSEWGADLVAHAAAASESSNAGMNERMEIVLVDGDAESASHSDHASPPAPPVERAELRDS